MPPPIQKMQSSRRVSLFQLIRFFSKKAKRVFIWPFAAFLSSVVGWGVLQADLADLHRTYQQDALSDAAALSQSYAESLQRAIALIDRLLLHVRYETATPFSALRLDDAQHSGLFPASPALSITLIDQFGTTQTSTPLNQGKRDFSHDQAFEFHANATADLLYIGAATLENGTQQPVLYLARRRSDSAGKFAGIVLATVGADYLAAGYNRTILGSYGLLALAGRDAVVHVIRAGDAGPRQRQLSMPVLPGLSARSGSVLLTGSPWFSDQRSRFLGWQALDRYPLIAVLGFDQAEALSSYELNRTTAIKSALWATAILSSFALLATALSIRLAWRAHTLERAQAAYLIAAESGTEGLFIGQPILDTDNSVVDILITDCNQRAAGFLRRRRDDVIGKTVLALYEGRDPEAFLQKVRKGIYEGSFEGEFEIAGQSPAALQWIHLKILYADGQLALTVRDISPSKAQLAALERQSTEDALTGLPNRHWLQGYLPRALRQATIGQTMVAVLFLDLDGFKGINDTLGHAAGDELLQNAAQRLKLAVRPHDNVVRLGGDEFVVIVEHVVDTTAVETVAERILQAFRENFRLSQGAASVGTSIGISIFPTQGTDAERLLQHADMALYSVKANDKGTYAFYNEQIAEARRQRAAKEAEFRRALVQDDFVVLYQPRVATANASLLGVEALMCWDHAVDGPVKPADFLRLAEDTGLIVEFGKLVAEKVCCQLAEWKRSGKAAVPVSINVSHQELIRADMVEFLLATMARHRVDPWLVQLELKERTAMGADAAVRQELKTIQQAGIELIVDNFGVGDVSIRTLQAMAFDRIKVHRSLTSMVGTSAEMDTFFFAVISMAHALGMHVVAEGVETERQAHALRHLQCDELQGFYISRPLTSHAVAALLAPFDPITDPPL